MRDRIEAGFAEWGRIAIRLRWFLLAVIVAATVLATLPLRTLEVDVSTESFLPIHDPARRVYDAFRDQFGTDEAVIVGVGESPVFDPAFLRELAELHAEIEAEVPYLREVDSLVNARDVRGVAGGLEVRELLERLPDDAADAARVAARVRANPMLSTVFVGADERSTALIVRAQTRLPVEEAHLAPTADPWAEGSAVGSADERPYLGSDERHAFVEALQDIAARHDRAGFRVHLSGVPVMNLHLMTAVQTNMLRFSVLALVVIGALLAALFRRVSGVVFPLLVVELSVVWLFGAMAWTGAPLQTVGQILPSFLLAVGIGDSVHLLAVFYRRLDAGAERQEAIVHALRHSGLAIVLTTLTTAGGLASFALADLASIAALGIYAPLGVLMALVVSLVALPALLAVTPVRRRALAGPHPAPAEGSRFDRLLVAFGELGTGRPKAVLVGFAAVWLVALAGAAQLRFGHVPVEWLPEDHPGRVATEWIDAELGGIYAVEVLVTAPEPQGLYEPALLERMDRMAGRALQVRDGPLGTRTAVSLVNVLEETHQALTANDPAAGRLPETRAAVAQELLLFESAGSDDLEQLTDPTFTTGRITLRVPSVDGLLYSPYVEHLTGELEAVLGDAGRVQITGVMPLIGRTMIAMVTSLSKTYGLALAIITPLMILMLGSLRGGLIAMLPNLTPVVATLGLMGWMGWRLDVFTLLIGSIIIGIAVDDTIHFMHNFMRARRQGLDVRAAVRDTLLTTGRALLVTSLVLTAGFLVYASSELSNLVSFGLLAAFAIVVAFLADVILTPALATLYLGDVGRARS